MKPLFDVAPTVGPLSDIREREKCCGSIRARFKQNRFRQHNNVLMFILDELLEPEACVTAIRHADYLSQTQEAQPVFQFQAGIDRMAQEQFRCRRTRCHENLLGLRDFLRGIGLEHFQYRLAVTIHASGLRCGILRIWYNRSLWMTRMP